MNTTTTDPATGEPDPPTDHPPTDHPPTDPIPRLPRLGRKTHAYWSLLCDVTRHGLRTRSGAVIHDLTDMEATEALRAKAPRGMKWERTDINAIRNRLTSRHGCIRLARTRRCNVTKERGIGAYRAGRPPEPEPGLFD